MITVEEAKRIVQERISPSNGEPVSLGNAIGRVLFESVLSEVDLPPFPRSAMDGYAVIHNDISHKKELEVIDKVKAGDTEVPSLSTGQACRIYTGAPVPDGATAVVMQEKVEREGNLIRIQLNEVQNGENIREKGEELEKGTEALPKGTRITPAGVGFLASLGISEVSVHQKLSITVLTTGDELVDPGKSLDFGQIHESNSFALVAALKEAGYSNVESKRVPDSLETTINSVKRTQKEADVVLFSGGISVGDRDHVKEALEVEGVEEYFHKIRQKPGKPLFFGANDKAVFFGLPGNPAACLTCFYEYVLPYLKGCSGLKEIFPRTFQLPLSHSWRKKGDRAVFLKARFEGGEVTILEGQSSAMMRSFAKADGLVYLDAERNEVEEGALVEFHLL